MYRYIGNKTRLTPWLISRIQQFAAPGAVVADPMCGTAAVSEALRVAGFRVIASDIMTFAVHHARVRLLLKQAPNFRGLGLSYIDILAHLNVIPPVEGVFFREYSPEGRPLEGQVPRKYLSGNNARRLDAISRHIKVWKDEGRLTEVENSLLRHDLVLATNRVANIAGTYGHFRSTWSRAALSNLCLIPSKFMNFRTDHQILQGAAEDLAPSFSADVCYLDPPYMKRQYGANYHLIETVARGDEPEAVGVSGLRPWRDQYSVFCTRTRIQDAFRKLILTADCPVFLISYSSDGLLKEQELMELFDPLGDVSIEKRQFPRFRSNESALSSHVDEYLITLLKRDYVAIPLRHASVPM
jgi:adenine-specific DNA-methyltransferase